MPAGLSGGVTMTSTLVAKVADVAGTPASSASVIEVSSAVASTSPGAPSATCSARSVLEPKEKSTSTPSCSASNCVAELGEDVGERGRGEHRELAVVVTRRLVVGAAGGERREQHDGDEAAQRAAIGAAHAEVCRICGSMLPLWGTAVGSGVSTTTLVDLTDAIARTPGSSPSSAAASALISDTTR